MLQAVNLKHAFFVSESEYIFLILTYTIISRVVQDSISDIDPDGTQKFSSVPNTDIEEMAE